MIRVACWYWTVTEAQSQKACRCVMRGKQNGFDMDCCPKFFADKVTVLAGEGELVLLNIA